MSITPRPSQRRRYAAVEEAFQAAFPELSELSTAEVRLLIATARRHGRELIRASATLRAELATLVPLPYEERSDGEGHRVP
jgi:hypothetical protein